jgi:hypothetical protein
MAEPEASGRPREYPRHFGPLMRLLLCFLVFDMVFRGFSILAPWGDWKDELGMARLPLRLPTRAELAQLYAQADAKPGSSPVTDRLVETADDVWAYLKPWPEDEARRRIRSWADVGKWAFVYACTRMEMFENVVGFNQEWPMFSPNVSRRKWVARARLRFEDGSEREVRGLCDPADLTRYSHWNQEKVLSYELKVKDRRSHDGDEGPDDDAFGYCNLLSHRYPRNEAGSPLRTIRLFEVRYDFPPPGVDFQAYLKEQSGPPPSQVYPDFYEFDAKARNGKCLPRTGEK